MNDSKRMSAGRALRISLAVGALAIGGVMMSCSGGSAPIAQGSSARLSPGGAEADDGPVSREAQALLDRLAAEHAARLAREDVHATMERRARGTEAPPVISGGPSAQTNLSPTYEVEPADSEKPVVTVARSGGTPGRSTRPEREVPVTSPPADVNGHQARLVGELASILEDSANSPEWPIPTLMKLASLELFEPGVFNSHFVRGSGGVMALHPRDLDLLMAWRDMFVEARQQIDSLGETADLTGAAEVLADRLRGRESIRMPRVALCTRVDGFGLYNELKQYDGSYKLLVGRRHRLIVYVELDRFAHRAMVKEGVAGYTVELTQDLSLYHAGDQQDTLAWRKPDESIVDFSRNRRQDFFVVQIIDLPETLTVGSYRLKVRMTDHGRTPANETERIVRIDMVADASALRGD